MPQILPVKKVAEVAQIPFNFAAFFSIGDTLTTFEGFATVISGVDPNPSAMIGTVSAVLNPATILVTVQGGLPGVIYKIQAKATTNTGKVFLLDGPLAVVS